MRQRRLDGFRIACLAGAGLLLLAGCAKKEAAAGATTGYDTPEAAVADLGTLVGTGDEKRAEEMFGPGSMDLFRSGDEEEDRKAAEQVKAMLNEKVAFEEIDDSTRVALLGNDAWPFPIPLTKSGERWTWDTEKGREELLNRRIGYYELATLTSLHTYVDAQREYAAAGRDGNPPAFAQKFASTEGKQDGLYWATAEGEEMSPLGDLVATAAQHETGEPFQGYYYRLLTAQGPNAPGGAYSYVDDKGLMTRGFAAVAWPAKYGNSGVMTFLVNHRGIVYQKDLGSDTPTAAAAIEAFDPDDSWMPTGDFLLDEEAMAAIEAGTQPAEAGAAEGAEAEEAAGEGEPVKPAAGV